MLNDGSGFKKVYLATGFTDLRRGIDGLARIIRFQFQLDPYDKNTLFLFCGKRTDRIKGLIWEGDGFLLLYKRIENGNFRMAPYKRGSAGDYHRPVSDADAGSGNRCQTPNRRSSGS